MKKRQLTILKKEYKQATEKFETVVQMLPNAVPARNNFSLAYYYLGYIDKAIELAGRYLPMKIPTSMQIVILLYFTTSRVQPVLVKKQLRIISKIRTESEDYLYKIGDTYGSLGRHADAYRTFRSFLIIDSNNPMYVHLAAVPPLTAGSMEKASGFGRSSISSTRIICSQLLY